MNDNFAPIGKDLSVRGVLRSVWRDVEDEYCGALWFIAKPVLFLGVLGTVALYLMAYAQGATALILAVVALVVGFVASTIEIKKKILGLPRERSVLASLLTFEFWIYTFVALGAMLTYVAAGAVPVSLVIKTSMAIMDGSGGILPDFRRVPPPDQLETLGVVWAVIAFSLFTGVFTGFLAWSRLCLLTVFVVDGRVPSYRASWKMLKGHTWKVFQILLICNLPPFLVVAFFRTVATFTDPSLPGAIGIALTILLVSLLQSLLSAAAVAKIYLLVKDSRNTLLPEKRKGAMSGSGLLPRPRFGHN